MSEQYIDARGKHSLEYLDHCSSCKEDFAMLLHLRHKCGVCRQKELDSILNRPLFNFHWNKMWEHFDQVMKRVFS